MASPTTFITYPVNGVQTNFVHPVFESGISALEVDVDGVIQSSSLYTIANGEVVFAVAPQGTTLGIKRVTDLTSRVTDFINTSILDEDALDNDSKQAFFKLQELLDEANENRLVRRNPSLLDNWDLQARLAKNSQDPKDATDLATKQYVDAANTAAAITSIPITKVSDFVDFDDAITTLNGTGAITTLAITSVTAVTSNITVNDNITLWFLGPGRLDPSLGITLTINGGIDARINQHIFGGSGTVNGSPKITECNTAWFGAKGDNGVTDNKAPFQASNDFMETVGGNVRVGYGHFGTSGEVLVSDGVKFKGTSRVDQTATNPVLGTDIFPLDTHTDNRMFAQKDVSAPSNKGMGYSFMVIRGDKPSGGFVNKGIEQENSKYWVYRDLAFHWFGEQGIHISDTGSTVTHIENVFMRDCVQNTGLAGETGALQIESQDNTLINCEITTSSTSLVESGNRIALLFTGSAAENFVFGGQFETSEVGVVVRGAGGNKFIGSRSDINLLDGWQIRVGGNVFVGCEALNNSQNVTNVNDGFVLFAQNNLLTGCIARSNFAKVHRYGFRDASGVAGNHAKGCLSTGHGTAEFFEDVTTDFWMYDLITQATATVDSATPDVSDVRNLVMPTNTARTEITSLTGKRKGEHLTLRVASGNDLIPFILPGGNFRLQKPFYPRNNDTLSLYTNDGTVWNETGRLESGTIQRVRAQFSTDNTGVGGLGNHTIGYLPNNAIIIDAFYVVQTIPTSGTNIAEIAFGVDTNDPSGIVAATVVTDGVWDLTNQGVHLALPQFGSIATYTTRTTAVRPIIATVTVEALTLARIDLFIQYIDLT